MAFGGGDGPVLDCTEDNTWPAAPYTTAAIATLAGASDSAGADARQFRGAFPELDCIRDRLSERTIGWAERRSLAIGVSAERVLITAGIIDEDSYFRALSQWLGLDYETLDDRDRASCPVDDKQLLEAAWAGLLPLVIKQQLFYVVAPGSAHQWLESMVLCPGKRFRLTSPHRLNRFIIGQWHDALGSRATMSLVEAWPHLSASSPNRLLRIILATIVSLAVAAAAVLPQGVLYLFEVLLAVGFLTWLGLRLLGSFVHEPPSRPTSISDRELPFYTIIVPLSREARSVKGLVKALRTLDYPAEKLDIKFVIEIDDDETPAALAGLGLGSSFEIIVAPAVGPRTKPKALNAALPLARGSLTVIYDAEDRPEPDQLRRALDVFWAGNDKLACVQACLTIDNTDDWWLAGLFTAEYAAQFDLFLPGLAALNLPLPLGGSSNHFRTAVLREIGAWDPYNVTEDADLGMRLGRFGYRATVIRSTTYEEAPPSVRPWLNQRTRWFKGWMQTWVVHMRTPQRLLNELGLAGFVTFQLVVGGNVLAALIHPIFLCMVVYTIACGELLLSADGVSAALTWLFVTTFFAGYLVSVAMGLRGLVRRKVVGAAWTLSLVPLHWILLSIAAWRALFQLAHDPHGWEKTEHGLAKNSRRARMTSAVTLDAVLRGESAAPQRRMPGAD
jgi:cellulose synthase/poly-beta-1,6-N-acetylglucosamine synthase-like glycosyltransferase